MGPFLSAKGKFELRRLQHHALHFSNAMQTENANDYLRGTLLTKNNNAGKHWYQKSFASYLTR